MVKVKIFEDICNCKDLENKINAFLVDNDVEFVDIKYSTSFNHCSVFSALLIYKEK
ncbi:MAG: sporulation protein Cse60 [Bacteroidales bacterium]|nr:sporulation protein Cse60 [Bacteroidales bacterium]